MRPLILSGTSNPTLSHQIARELGATIGKTEIIRFADSECRVRVEEDVEGRDVFVIQSLCNPVDEHLMEFLFLCDAIKRGDPKRIIAVLPYHGYARQDRIHRPGECLSAQVVAKMIETADVDKLITLELHNETILGFFKIPVVHVTSLTVFEDLVRAAHGELVVITPDAGALKRAQSFAEHFGAPLAYIEKKRDLDKLHTIVSMKVVGDIKDKTAVIFDDVIVTGATLVNAAYLLKEKGAKQVIACAAHADFVGGTNKIMQDSPLDHVWVTDSIPIAEEQKFSKLKILPIASHIAKAMAKMIK